MVEVEVRSGIPLAAFDTILAEPEGREDVATVDDGPGFDTIRVEVDIRSGMPLAAFETILARLEGREDTADEGPGFDTTLVEVDVRSAMPLVDLESVFGMALDELWARVEVIPADLDSGIE